MSQNLNFHGNPVGYRGTVTIKTLQDDQVVSKRVFHNKGLPKFFSNICWLIASAPLSRGSMVSKLPAYLRLYSLRKKASDSYVDYTADECKSDEDLLELCRSDVGWYNIVDDHFFSDNTSTADQSSCRLYAASSLLPIVERLHTPSTNESEIASDDQNRSSVTLQWRIRTQNITENQVFLLALFSGEASGTEGGKDSHHNHALAYYKLTQQDEGGTEHWAPITVNKSAYDFAIIVEWKLEFDNAGAYTSIQNNEED